MSEAFSSILRDADDIQDPYARMSRMQQLVMQAGWRWNNAADVLAKTREELEEVAEAMETGSRNKQVDELADLIFMSTLLCHYLNIKPEDAISSAMAKLERRFGHVERSAAAQGYTVATAPGDIRYQWYLEAKESEKKIA